MQRETRQLHEKRSDRAEKIVFRMGEGGGCQHAVVLQHPPDLPQRHLRLGNDVQRVGYDHHVKGLIRVGQVEHILHGDVQLCRVVLPLRLRDHLLGGVRRLDVLRRADDVLGDQPCARGQLQYRLVPHHRAEQVVHLRVSPTVLVHEAVVDRRVPVPEIPVFFHTITL